MAGDIPCLDLPLLSNRHDFDGFTGKSFHRTILEAGRKWETILERLGCFVVDDVTGINDIQRAFVKCDHIVVSAKSVVVGEPIAAVPRPLPFVETKKVH